MFSVNETARSTATLEFMISLARAGLNQSDSLVMASLAEALEVCGALAEGETTVQQSRWEIAARTKLTLEKVKRSLAKLVSAGYIVRAQATRKDGDVARTMLTAKALALLGMRGGANVTGSAPPELVALMIGEDAATIDKIIACWNDGRMPDSSFAASSFRGGGSRWAQIEFLLSGRVAVHQTALLSAAEEAHEAARLEAAGEYPLTLPSGTAVVLSNAPFRTRKSTSAHRAVDMRFVRDTIARLASQHPTFVTETKLPSLIAELSFSRSSGFIYKHDAAAAMRVVVSCISKQKWGRPRGIDSTWYAAASSSIYPQAAQN